jgi:hypothetical protein
MKRDVLTTEKVVQILNTLIATDSEMMNNLFHYRTKICEHLADNSDIQCGKTQDGYDVGVLGFINGLFGTDDNQYGPIAATYQLVCEHNDCKANISPKLIDGKTVGDWCPVCERGRLVLGKVLSFIKIW